MSLFVKTLNPVGVFTNMNMVDEGDRGSLSQEPGRAPENTPETIQHQIIGMSVKQQSKGGFTGPPFPLPQKVWHAVSSADSSGENYRD